jgi:hypothetical protein
MQSIFDYFNKNNCGVSMTKRKEVVIEEVTKEYFFSVFSENSDDQGIVQQIHKHFSLLIGDAIFDELEWGYSKVASGKNIGAVYTFPIDDEHYYPTNFSGRSARCSADALGVMLTLFTCQSIEGSVFSKNFRKLYDFALYDHGEKEIMFNLLN